MQKRSGGCHCKAVRYEVDIDLAQPVLECNCSHCEIKGLLLAFVPQSSVTILSGADNLTDYRFNTEQIEHLFCKTCGVQVFGRGSKNGVAMSGINVRTIDDIDIHALTRTPFDGKSR